MVDYYSGTKSCFGLRIYSKTFKAEPRVISPTIVWGEYKTGFNQKASQQIPVFW